MLRPPCRVRNVAPRVYQYSRKTRPAAPALLHPTWSFTMFSLTRYTRTAAPIKFHPSCSPQHVAVFMMRRNAVCVMLHSPYCVRHAAPVALPWPCLHLSYCCDRSAAPAMLCPQRCTHRDAFALSPLSRPIYDDKRATWHLLRRARHVHSSCFPRHVALAPPRSFCCIRHTALAVQHS